MASQFIRWDGFVVTELMFRWMTRTMLREIDAYLEEVAT